MAVAGAFFLRAVADTWPRKSAPQVAPAIPEIFPAPLPAIAGPVGDIKRFLLACVPRARGERVTLGAVYARYRAMVRRDEGNGNAGYGLR